LLKTIIVFFEVLIRPLGRIESDIFEVTEPIHEYYVSHLCYFFVSGQQSPSDIYARGLVALAATLRTLADSVRCVGLRSSSLEAELRVPPLPDCA